MEEVHPSKMIVHLYIAPSFDDSNDYLMYDSKVVVEGDMSTELPNIVVKHYVNRLLQKKEVPYDIEQHFENLFAEEQSRAGNSSSEHTHQNYLSEMSFDDYHAMLRRIIDNKAECKALFTYWTHRKPEMDTLVCVAEGDLCAPFLLSRFPPVEMYMRMDIERPDNIHSDVIGVIDNHYDDCSGVCSSGGCSSGGGGGGGYGDGDDYDEGDNVDDRDGPSDDA
jgi:hypothetical protein